MIRHAATVFIVLVLQISAIAQAGGTFEITDAVIAGGGDRSSGGSYSLEGTIGQGIAGSQSTGTSSRQNMFALRGGFWTAEALAPTAAQVSVSGRVSLDQQTGMNRVRITLQNTATGESQTAIPSPFGYFQFENVEIGFYLISAASKMFEFSPPAYTVNINENLTDITFSGARSGQ